MTIRKPAVAGQFYPANKEKLEEAIVSLIKKGLNSNAAKNRVKGLILPHAGYQYSGAVAAETVASSELQSTFIILGPNHTGMGESFSVMTEGYWQTPLGDVEIDFKLADEIVKNSKYFKSDTLAHLTEHSIEVLLPFLQFVKGKIKFVPIVVARADEDIYKLLAKDIYNALVSLKKEEDVLLIASSDMTHYESHESATKKDQYAIEAILGLDAQELLKRVNEMDISMCGIAPVAIMLETAKNLGAHHANLVKYQTSAEATGDYSSVVGYAGVRVH